MPTRIARTVLGPFHPRYRDALQLYVTHYRQGASALPPTVRGVRVLAPSGFVELELADTDSVEEALGTSMVPLEFSTTARSTRGGRMEDLCRETWGQLPEHVRERIQGYCAARGRPLSVLLSGSPPAHFPQAGQPLAQVSAAHNEVWFSTEVLGFPQKAARAAVAHEMGHIYLLASVPSHKGLPAWWGAWLENRVDACVKAWGFANRKAMFKLVRAARAASE